MKLEFVLILVSLSDLTTGEMHFIQTTADSWFNLPRDGGVAYAAQESWVQNETIRENILFGSPFDEVRYRKGKFIISTRSVHKSPLLSKCLGSAHWRRIWSSSRLEITLKWVKRVLHSGIHFSHYILDSFFSSNLKWWTESELRNISFSARSPKKYFQFRHESHSQGRFTRRRRSFC